MQSSHRNWLFPVLILLLIAAGVLYWVIPFRAELYADTTTRDPKAPDETRTVSLPEPEDLAEMIQDVSIDSETPSILVEMEGGRTPKVDLAQALPRLEMNQDETLELPGGGTFRFVGMSVYIPEPPSAEGTENRRGTRAPIYGPDLMKITEEEMAPGDLQSFRSHGSRSGSSMEFRGVYRFEGDGPVQILKTGWRDAGTLFELSQGGFWSDNSERLSAGAPFDFWRKAPVYHDMVIAYGEPEVQVVEAEAGALAEFSKAQASLVEMIPITEQSSYSSGSRILSQNKAVQEFGFKSWGEEPGERNHTGALFAVEPAELRAAVEVEFLDAEGEVLWGGGGSASGRFMQKSVDVRPEEIDRVRFSFYPELASIRVRYDYLPETGEFGNDNIENLFDTTIPYVQFNNMFEFRRFLESSSQMHFVTPGRGMFVPNAPPDYFPREFSNVTVRQLTEEYLSLFEEGTEIECDQDTRELRIIVPSKKKSGIPFFDWLKQKLGI